MEEWHPGQEPGADRPSPEKPQGCTMRREAMARHDSPADEEDRRLLHEAEEHARPFNEQLRASGFGDHVGVVGFP